MHNASTVITEIFNMRCKSCSEAQDEEQTTKTECNSVSVKEEKITDNGDIAPCKIMLSL